MIRPKEIKIFRQPPNTDWIAPLNSASAKQLAAKPGFPLRLLDENNFCEFSAPDEFPGERLAVCQILN